MGWLQGVGLALRGRPAAGCASVRLAPHAPLLPFASPQLPDVSLQRRARPCRCGGSTWGPWARPTARCSTACLSSSRCVPCPLAALCLMCVLGMVGWVACPLAAVPCVCGGGGGAAAALLALLLEGHVCEIFQGRQVLVVLVVVLLLLLLRRRLLLRGRRRCRPAAAALLLLLPPRGATGAAPQGCYRCWCCCCPRGLLVCLLRRFSLERSAAQGEVPASCLPCCHADLQRRQRGWSRADQRGRCRCLLQLERRHAPRQEGRGQRWVGLLVLRGGWLVVVVCVGVGGCPAGAQAGASPEVVVEGLPAFTPIPRPRRVLLHQRHRAGDPGASQSASEVGGVVGWVGVEGWMGVYQGLVRGGW